MSQSTNKPSIAAFDFDNTITIRDTAKDFLFYSFPRSQVMWNSIKWLPFFVLGKFGIIDNEEAKQHLFYMFLQNLSVQQFQEKCTQYSLKRIPQIIRKEAMNKIKWHKDQGHKVVVISASFKAWIKPWAEENNIDKIIATEIIFGANKKIKKNFIVENCYGENKVKHFLKQFPNRDEYELYVYGDNKETDGPLLNIADHAFYRKFLY